MRTLSAPAVAGAPGSWLARVCLTGGLAITLSLHGATITDDFGADPAARGWHSFGDTNLFSWDSAAGKLNVTWDSSRTNSYFYRPLGTILDRQDDFGFAVDLKLLDFAGGINPDKDSTFQLGLGFLNLDNATRTNFFRGNGALCPNLVEFDFFPDTGFGPTVWPAAWSTNSTLSYNGANDYTLLNLPVIVTMRVSMSYSASNQTIRTTITTNGVAVGVVSDVKLSPTFTDFRVGAFAFESYSDAGQNPMFGGSLLAHGIVDNVVVTFPPPPVQNLAGRLAAGQWQMLFTSRTNWVYTLERSPALQSWAAVSMPTAGNGGTLMLTDTSPLPGVAFYRVRAERP